MYFNLYVVLHWFFMINRKSTPYVTVHKNSHPWNLASDKSLPPTSYSNSTLAGGVRGAAAPATRGIVSLSLDIIQPSCI